MAVTPPLHKVRVKQNACVDNEHCKRTISGTELKCLSTPRAVLLHCSMPPQGFFLRPHCTPDHLCIFFVVEAKEGHVVNFAEEGEQYTKQYLKNK